MTEEPGRLVEDAEVIAAAPERSVPGHGRPGEQYRITESGDPDEDAGRIATGPAGE